MIRYRLIKPAHFSNNKERFQVVKGERRYILQESETNLETYSIEIPGLMSAHFSNFCSPILFRELENFGIVRYEANPVSVCLFVCNVFLSLGSLTYPCTVRTNIRHDDLHVYKLA